MDYCGLFMTKQPVLSDDRRVFQKSIFKPALLFDHYPIFTFFGVLIYGCLEMLFLITEAILD